METYTDKTYAGDSDLAGAAVSRLVWQLILLRPPAEPGYSFRMDGVLSAIISNG